MKKLNKNLALGIFGLLFFAACKKSENGPVLSPNEKLLTAKVWELKTLTVPGEEEETSILIDCAKEASMAFDAYKNFQFADPTKECDSTVVPYDKGKWAFNATGDSLILEGKRKLAWKIVKLDESMLQATFRDSISPEENVVKTITLK